jgi:hypothetical protein
MGCYVSGCSGNEDDDEYAWPACEEHVRCDEKCGALQEPGDSIEELKKALEHWRSHSYLAGCSHGS